MCGCVHDVLASGKRVLTTPLGGHLLDPIDTLHMRVLVFVDVASLLVHTRHVVVSELWKKIIVST